MAGLLKRLGILAALALLCACGQNTDMTATLFQLDSTRLALVRQMIQDDRAPERVLSAFEELLENADRLLGTENPSVMDKSIAPPSGDKHDYLSISRYWWPDPQSQDGKPWIRKDGQTNPFTQSDAVDRHSLSRMSNGVKTLCLAYYFTEDERYAQKAASMLNTWFLEEGTRMNPHLEYAQSVPGYPSTRPYGILDGRPIVMVVPDALAILSGSSHWTANQEQKMIEWLGTYLAWLRESELGQMGLELENNHGSWYKFQVASLAFYLGNDPMLREMVELAQQSLGDQLNDKGGQIHELARTKSFSYSCFNLSALTGIALLGDRIGMDMWHYESGDGKSLSLAVDYLAPVVEGVAWPHASMNGPELSKFAPILIRMSDHSESEKYADLLDQVLVLLAEEEEESGTVSKTLQELCFLHGTCIP